MDKAVRWPVTSSWADVVLTVAVGVAILVALALLAGCAVGGRTRAAPVTVHSRFRPPECPT